MTVALARRLMWEGVVTPEDVSTALQAHVTERIAFLRALVRRDPALVDRLEAELGHVRGASAPAIVPDADLVRALPPGLPALLLAYPVGRDPVTGIIKVIAADPSDTQIASEMAHHLGAPVEIASGPLRVLLDAVVAESPKAVDRRPARTPAFGMNVLAPSSKPPRATPDALQPHAAAPAPALVPAGMAIRPSDRPIPLVRVSDAPGPRTQKGVAPQASGAAFASSVVVPPRVPAKITAEPIIQLTRTKSIAPSSPSSSPASSTPSAQISRTFIGSEPGSEDFGLADFQNAATPEDVVSILVRGLSRVARRVVVLAVRGKVFEGRDTNVEANRDAVRALVISADRPSVALTAVQAGQYVGPMPQTLVHQELSRVLGGPNDDIAVGSVTVTGRAALVFIAAGLDTAYLATRRGEELSLAASRALARIVRERKK